LDGQERPGVGLLARHTAEQTDEVNTAFPSFEQRGPVEWSDIGHLAQLRYRHVLRRWMTPKPRAARRRHHAVPIAPSRSIAVPHDCLTRLTARDVRPGSPGHDETHPADAAGPAALGVPCCCGSPPRAPPEA